MRRTAILLMLLSSPAAPAAVVVLANATPETVKCVVTVGAAEPLAVELAVGESKPITCGRTVEVSYAAADGAKRLRLDPYTAYLFVTKKKTGLELMAIDLAGKSPGDKDIPPAAPAVKPLRIAVKLLVDDAERRTRPIWIAALKKRLGEASEVLLRQAGVAFVPMDYEEWTADANANHLRTALDDFEKQVKAEPANLAVGFMSRPFPPPMGKQPDLPFAISHGMSSPFILLREGDPRTEPERVEVLVASLGRYLGAVASPDPISAMRPKLGDGKAVHAKFRIGFDPLNVLAMNLVADELRRGRVRKLADWPEATQVRLARIYATLSAAVPEEPLNEEVAALLERAGLKAAAAPDLRPMAPNAVEAPKARPANLTAEQDAIRKVVKAIAVKAEENARAAATARVKGDELTELYIRAAADTAYTLDQELRQKAFLVGLGIALDDSEVVRKNPLFPHLALWKACETDDERKARVAVLGNPTVRFRRDLCQHFALSAALAGLDGPAKAEAFGLTKELWDMHNKNGTGFDFSDLAADFAGVEFAGLVLANGERLAVIRQRFTVNDYVPKVDDLADGLSKTRFETLYGSPEDKRFQDAVAKVKDRVKELRAYQAKKEN